MKHRNKAILLIAVLLPLHSVMFGQTTVPVSLRAGLKD